MGKEEERGKSTNSAIEKTMEFMKLFMCITLVKRLISIALLEAGVDRACNRINRALRTKCA